MTLGLGRSLLAQMKRFMDFWVGFVVAIMVFRIIVLKVQSKVQSKVLSKVFLWRAGELGLGLPVMGLAMTIMIVEEK